MNHSFEGKKNTLPYGTNIDNAMDIFSYQYGLFWDYIRKLNFYSKIYNLGEGFDYNISSDYSKIYFPLTDEIKEKIRR